MMATGNMLKNLVKFGPVATILYILPGSKLKTVKDSAFQRQEFWGHSDVHKYIKGPVVVWIYVVDLADD